MRAQATAEPVAAAVREQTRARYPDETGFVERDGVNVFWELYGSGPTTILLLPTWSIIQSRRWKAQIPFLARHWRALTFDGRGCGRSDRPASTEAYADAEFVADAIAVMDATATERAVLVGVSMGAGFALRLAAEHPHRVAGAVFEGSAIAVGEARPVVDAPEEQRHRHSDDGWYRYDHGYWRMDYPDFVEFFMGQCLSEPHSTKPIEDAIGWGLEIDPETLIRTDAAPYLGEHTGDDSPERIRGIALDLAARVRCPSLVIHGSDDRVVNVRHGKALARALGAPFVELRGSGHLPSARDPVRYNLLLRDFIRSLEGASS
jgi:pimeloyl-ACP methyl ester carboxylesterase